MKIVLTTLNAKYIHSALALYYLKAYCTNEEAEIKIKEYSVNNELLDILGDIYGEKPDIIGMACYIWNIEMSLKLAALLRKVLPNVTIILGGPEVTYDSEEILAKQPAVDYIIRGEGEEIFAQLLHCLANNDKPHGIAGITYKQHDTIISVGEAQVVHNLDQLPFPYNDIAIHSLKDKLIYYETSRGCPYSCQYCLSSATIGVRFVPLMRVLDELAFFIRHNVKQVKFVDRTFNSRKEHYLPIIKFLAGQNCSTNFHFEIAADILDEETLAALAIAPPGRFQLEIGVQSTNEATLKEIRRNNNWPRIVEYVSRLRAFDTIHLHLDLIAGLPCEDLTSFGKSFNDVFSLKPHMLQLGFLKLLKGSGIRQRATLDEYVYMDTPPYEVLSNRFISYDQIRSLKILEEILNLTYNSARFLVTIEWFAAHAGGGFEFFRDFAAYWERHNLHLVSHSAKTIYRFYADYCEDKGLDKVVCLQLLKFDALTCDGGTVRPDFLPWNGTNWEEAKNLFFRNEETAQKYIPNYRFSTWRQIKKQYHLEIFDLDIMASHNKGTIAYLFIYQEQSVKIIKVNLSDLLPEGTEPERAL